MGVGSEREIPEEGAGVLFASPLGALSAHLMCVELVTPAVRFILSLLCALEKRGQTLCRGNNNVFG